MPSTYNRHCVCYESICAKAKEVRCCSSLARQDDALCVPTSCKVAMNVFAHDMQVTQPSESSREGVAKYCDLHKLHRQYMSIGHIISLLQMSWKCVWLPHQKYLTCRTDGHVQIMTYYSQIPMTVTLWGIFFRKCDPLHAQKVTKCSCQFSSRASLIQV